MGDAARVLAFLNGPDCPIEATLDADTALISSGLMDSLALFQLLLWVESELGRPLDPASFDLARAWETPAAIAAFIAARSAPVAPPPAAPAPLRTAAHSDDYRIVRYTPDHDEGVVRLEQVLMNGRDPALIRRYLAWKYEEAPAAQGRRHYLALDRKGAVVGMRGVFATRWEAGGESLHLPAVADLAIDPAHRNRGLYSRIMAAMFDDLRAEGHSHVVSLSAAAITSVGALAQGFRMVAAVEPLMHRPAVPLRAWRRLRRALNAEPDTWLRLARAPAGIEVATAARPQAMAALVERLGHDGRIRQRRDAAWFAWRHAAPLVGRRFFYAGAAALEGYLVLVAFPGRPGAPLRIVDWEAATPAVAAQLLDAALAVAGWRNVVAWNFGLDASKRRLVAERGFAPVKPAGAAGFRTAVLVKPLTADPARASQWGGRAIFDPQNWDYRMIYADMC